METTVPDALFLDELFLEGMTGNLEGRETDFIFSAALGLTLKVARFFFRNIAAYTSFFDDIHL